MPTNVLEAFIINHRCSNATTTVCTTPSLRSLGKEHLLYELLPASLELADGVDITLNESFVYKEDPVIDRINPLRTFAK